MLEVGMKAPEFTLKNQDGEDISLSSFLGKRQYTRLYKASMRIFRTYG